MRSRLYVTDLRNVFNWLTWGTMPRMRVVQAFGSPSKGGAERFFVRLAKALASKGVIETVLVRRGGWIDQQLSAEGVHTDGAWFGGALDLFTTYKFRRVLQQTRADIVLTFTRRTTLACPPGPWLHVGRLGNYYDIKHFLRCDHLIGITPGITDYIKQNNWPSDRVTFIPNFVPAVEATPMPRAALGTPDDAPLILWLGRMEHEKGPDIVVRALKDVPGAYLWMAGHGSFLQKVKELSGQLDLLDRVRILGWRDDIHSLLEAADIYVCASRFEAHGNIVLEAWMHGLPIVSARSPGPEHLIADGETGLLVANDDPAAMAAAFNQLIANADLAKRLGNAGRRHFLATYSEEAVTAMYLRLFEQLIVKGKRRVA